MPTDDLSRAVARMRSEGPESLSAKVTDGEWHGPLATPQVSAEVRKHNGAFFLNARTDAPLLADTLHRLAEIVGCDVGELEVRVASMKETLSDLLVKWDGENEARFGDPTP